MFKLDYIGSELELFSCAKNWKRYFASFLSKYIQGDVLEVGAGIGSNTELLFSPSVSSWSCLEPDPELLQNARNRNSANSKCRFIQGTSNDLKNDQLFDVILYIDVLEHIERDKDEILRVQRFLKNGGHIIILSPAHNFLYSPFDKSVGHFRRYNKKSLRLAFNEALICQKLIYLDALGFFLSLANKTISKQSNPTYAQIIFWDKIVVPLSKIVDFVLAYHFGKSILGIWRKV